MRALLSLSVLAAVTFTAACSNRPRREEPRARRSTSTEAHATTTPAPVAAPIARERVDEFLATWLASQNEGKFDAYEASYARRFDGVRRTRSKTVRLDRTGWMADRRRMFARPIQVAVSDVDVRTTLRTADVELTQRWSSGRYSDVGRKRLLLVDEGGALRISVEEMLETRPTSTLEAGLSSPAWFTIETREGTFAVLGGAGRDDATGKARLVSTGAAPRVALRDVEPAALQRVKGLLGTKVHVDTCEATVVGFAIAAVVEPHFGVEQEWSDEDFDETTAPHAKSDDAIAEDVFGLTDSPSLVAKLDRPCAGSLAIRASLRSLEADERALDVEAKASLQAAFERRPEAAETRRDLEGGIASELEGSDAKPWTDYLTFRSWELSGVTYVSVRVHFNIACSTAVMETYLYRLENGALVPATPDPSANQFDGELTMLDIEGDGVPEVVEDALLGTRTIYRLDRQLTPVMTAYVDFQDCLC